MINFFKLAFIHWTAVMAVLIPVMIWGWGLMPRSWIVVIAGYYLLNLVSFVTWRRANDAARDFVEAETKARGDG